MAHLQSLRRSTARGLAAVAALGTAVAVLAGCGGMAPDTGGAASTGSAADALRVGIFVDNAFGDGDFFDQAAKAEPELKDKLGATVKTYEGQLQAQNFAPLLQDAADANDIVFVLGFEAIDAMNSTAAANPDTQFVFLDGDAGSSDVLSAVFKTKEGCFMAGALAATVNKSAGSSTAGFIGGVNAPVVENCEAGYTAGVAQVDPGQTVAAQYVGSFTDPAKGSEIATSMASTRGVDAVFAYAGLSGSGAFDAAKSGAALSPIGVVADKSALAPGKVPGSLTMGVDTVIADIAARFADDNLDTSTTLEYGFADGGWAMVYDTDLLTADQISSLDALQSQLEAGKFTF